MAKWYEAQIGPLPAYAWIGAVIGAVVVVVYTRQKAAKTAKTTAATTPTSSYSGSGVPGASDASLGGGSIGTGGLVVLPQGSAFGQYPVTQLGTEPQFQTNSEWESYAEQVLSAQGYDATLAGQALSVYLEGGSPTAQEQGLIEIALKAVGPPPTPPPTLGSTTPVFAPPPGQTQSGGGLLPGKGAPDTVNDRAGNTYQYSPNWSANYAALVQGQTLYYEVTPGVFNPFTLADYNTVGTGALGAAGFSAPLWIRVAQVQAA